MSARARLIRATRLARRRISLPDALLCGRLPAYLANRLRPLLVYRLLGLGAHLTELFLLTRLLPDRSLLASVALHNLCGLGSAFFWGALEPVRERVRRLLNPAEAVLLGAPYLMLAISLGALFCALSAWPLIRSQGGLAELYGCALVFRLALDLITRALQIPIAAKSRIFRPPLWLLARPLISPLVLLGAWDLLGATSLPLAVALSALAQFVVTALYTLRCYRLQRMPAPRSRLRQLALLSRASTLRTQLTAGLAGALPMSASLLICALVATGAARDSGRNMLVVLHALVPLLLTAGGWTQVVYVDLHWLLKPWRAAMLRRFEVSLEKTSALLALALLPWIAGAARLLAHHQALAWTLATAPLLLAQAWLATLQLGLFVRQRYRPLALAGLVQAAGILLATLIISRLVLVRGAEICLICALVDFALIAVLRRMLAQAPARPALESRKLHALTAAPIAEPLALYAWVRALSKIDEPIRAGALALPLLGGVRLQALLAKLEALAGRPGVAASASGTRLVFWMPAARFPSGAALLATGAGMIERVTLFELAPDGRAALKQLDAAGMLAETGESLREVMPLETVDSIDLRKGTCPPAIRDLPLAQRRRIFLAAERAARGLKRLGDALPFAPIADCPDGILASILVVPRETPAGLRSALRRRAHARSLAASR